MKDRSVSFDLRAVAQAFALEGEFLGAAPYGTGHINDTFVSIYDQRGARKRTLHQRINPTVFADPVALMDNILRVTQHQHSKLAALEPGDRQRRALTVLPGPDGAPYWIDPDGGVWRSYLFLEGAQTYDVIESEAQAEAAARAFGEFLLTLSDMQGGRLHESIPRFHDTPWRFEELVRALEADPQNRAQSCKAEIDAALAQRDVAYRLTPLIEAGKIPERVTHNDTKLNNVMIDDATGEGICVIDLDTIMPGLALYDFGDMVRTATMTAREDEADLSLARMQDGMFQALARGYVRATAEVLTPVERDHLAFAGQLMTFEVGLRFLTDHLMGDVYFKVHQEGQNLARARTQFALAADIAVHHDAMAGYIESLS